MVAFWERSAQAEEARQRRLREERQRDYLAHLAQQQGGGTRGGADAGAGVSSGAAGERERLHRPPAGQGQPGLPNRGRGGASAGGGGAADRARFNLEGSEQRAPPDEPDRLPNQVPRSQSPTAGGSVGILSASADRSRLEALLAERERLRNWEKERRDLERREELLQRKRIALADEIELTRIEQELQRSGELHFDPAAIAAAAPVATAPVLAAQGLAPAAPVPRQRQMGQSELPNWGRSVGGGPSSIVFGGAAAPVVQQQSQVQQQQQLHLQQQQQQQQQQRLAAPSPGAHPLLPSPSRLQQPEGQNWGRSVGGGPSSLTFGISAPSAAGPDRSDAERKRQYARELAAQAEERRQREEAEKRRLESEEEKHMRKFYAELQDEQQQKATFNSNLKKPAGQHPSAETPMDAAGVARAKELQHREDLRKQMEDDRRRREERERQEKAKDERFDAALARQTGQQQGKQQQQQQQQGKQGQEKQGQQQTQEKASDQAQRGGGQGRVHTRARWGTSATRARATPHSDEEGGGGREEDEEGEGDDSGDESWGDGEDGGGGGEDSRRPPRRRRHARGSARSHAARQAYIQERFSSGGASNQQAVTELRREWEGERMYYKEVIAELRREGERAKKEAEAAKEDVRRVKELQEEIRRQEDLQRMVHQKDEQILKLQSRVEAQRQQLAQQMSQNQELRQKIRKIEEEVALSRRLAPRPGAYSPPLPPASARLPLSPRHLGSAPALPDTAKSLAGESRFLFTADSIAGREDRRLPQESPLNLDLNASTRFLQSRDISTMFERRPHNHHPAHQALDNVDAGNYQRLQTLRRMTRELDDADSLEELVSDYIKPGGKMRAASSHRRSETAHFSPRYLDD